MKKAIREQWQDGLSDELPMFTSHGSFHPLSGGEVLFRVTAAAPGSMSAVPHEPGRSGRVVRWSGATAGVT
jgi:hypothetical protein